MHNRPRQSQAVPRVQPGILFVILMMMILVQISIDLYVPSLPAITRAFHSTESSIQYTLFFFLFGLGISHLFFGPLSDKIGRKPPLIYGIGISIVGSLCCLFAPMVTVLILGRFLQGFGIGSCSSVGRSLVRDLFTDRYLSKIGSYVGVVSTLLLVASPILGGYIQEHFGWRANFLFIFVLSLSFWVLIILVLPETNKNLNPMATKIRVIKGNYSTLLKSQNLFGIHSVRLLCLCGFYCLSHALPFYIPKCIGIKPFSVWPTVDFYRGSYLY